jgi:hypothetical protein
MPPDPNRIMHFLVGWSKRDRLPVHMQELLAFAKVRPKKDISAQFSHFKPYQGQRECYNLSLQWEVPVRDIATIDSLQVQLSCRPERGFIRDFFPLDCKTSHLSSPGFPLTVTYPDSKIPKQDKQAVTQFRQMKEVFKDEFAVIFLEEFVRLPLH